MPPSPELAAQVKALLFTPERWGQAERFARFASTTYQLNSYAAGCLQGVVGHFRKAEILLEVACDLARGLEDERRELEERGHSSAQCSRRLAAVVEEVLCELYGSVECTAQVLRGIYSGLPDSSRKLFKKATAGELGERLPNELQQMLVEAHGWVQPLWELRDAITHVEPGFSSQSDDRKVRYYNSAPTVAEPGRSYVLEDVFGRIGEYQGQVNHFLGRVFGFLTSTLRDTEVKTMCGLFGGRGYVRVVRPSDLKDLSSGRCDSYQWFEEPQHPTCPLAEVCGAYERVKKSREGVEAQPCGGGSE